MTDHSERSWASRKLLSVEIPLQRQEIETVRAQVPGMEILHGVEVDIMPDGSLDFDDDTLAGFDIVLASLHDPAGEDGAQLTQRYVQAMWHPLVTIITHPANRSPALSNGYELDFNRLFRAAVQTEHRHGDRRRSGSSRYGRTHRPAGGGRGCDPRGQQRLPSGGRIGTADELRRRHGAPRVGLPRAGAQYARNRRCPGVHRPETGTFRRAPSIASTRPLLPTYSGTRLAVS